jgi:hypothetical protein
MEIKQMGTNESSRRRGKPPTPYPAKWLGWTEFAFVKAMVGKRSLTSLDVEFARLSDGSRCTSAERTKAFDHAKNRGRRLPDDVIKRLAKVSGLALIKHIAASSFWPLLVNPPTTRTAATRMAERCLQRLNLVRLPVEQEEAWIAKKWEQAIAADRRAEWQDEDSLVRRRIEHLAAEYPQNLDLVALLGALYREACLTFEPDAACYLGMRFWMLLEDFFGAPQFDAISAELCDFAVNRIIYDRDEAEARKPFSTLGPDRMPGKAVGLLLSADDSDALELLSRTD